MAIRFRCEHCEQLLSIATRQAGKTVPCPTCGAELVVPVEDEAAEPAEEREAPASQPETTGHPVAEPPEFSLRRPQTELEEMDLTPMVDVTFLLLIFFMITASFSVQKTIEVPEPEPEEKGAAQTIQTLQDLQSDSIIVEVDERNAIYVDYERVENPGNLSETLRDKMRSDGKVELVLEADARALHETVVQVVDAANAAGMQKIRLVTRSEDS